VGEEKKMVEKREEWRKGHLNASDLLNRGILQKRNHLQLTYMPHRLARLTISLFAARILMYLVYASKYLDGKKVGCCSIGGRRLKDETRKEWPTRTFLLQH
jgi:hypothetical protein